jgi:hypothetical protein
MQRINNKTKKSLSRDPFEKHPGKFLKRDTSGRIRQKAKNDIEQFDLEVVHTPSHRDKDAIRKQSGNCPLCLLRLERVARGTRFCNICQKCKAQLKPEIHCKHCDSNRVWGRAGEHRCKGCGKKVDVA